MMQGAHRAGLGGYLPRWRSVILFFCYCYHAEAIKLSQLARPMHACMRWLSPQYWLTVALQERTKLNLSPGLRQSLLCPFA